MIKKTFLACLMTLMALMTTHGAKAQTLEDLMPMVVQEMNKDLKPSDPVNKVEWNAASSSLILFVNKDVVAESGLDAASLNSPETKQFIKDAMFQSQEDASAMAEALEALEQLGVRILIRIPIGNSHTDMSISSADFK